MKAIYDDFKECVTNSENIFDLYIYIYKILKLNLSDLKSSLENEYDEGTYWKQELNTLEDTKGFSVDIREEDKESILKLTPSKDKGKFLSFLKLLFEQIDEIAQDKYYSTSMSYLQEDDDENMPIIPLNKGESLKIGKVFYKQDNLFEKIIKLEDRFKLEKDMGETVEVYQNNLLVRETESSDTKTHLFRVVDKYISRWIEKKKSNFKIALIPFSNDKKILQLDEIQRNGTDYMFINGINQEAEYIKLVGDILENLIEQEVDIVVFPEMIFTQNMINKVKEIISENYNKLLLVVCGSVWESRTNTCITLGGNGLEIGRQNKLNRYSENGKIEDIELNSDQKIINVYDIENFGRLCTPICVDFITEDYFCNIAQVGVNMCLLPTYTSSLKVFEDKASSLGTKRFGAVFLANYCGIANKDKIAFAYMPRKGQSIYPITCEQREQKECRCNFPKENYIIEIIQ